MNDGAKDERIDILKEKPKSVSGKIEQIKRTIKAGVNRVDITRPDKILFPKDGLTKMTLLCIIGDCSVMLLI